MSVSFLSYLFMPHRSVFFDAVVDAKWVINYVAVYQ
jgi:hypothetical protein